MYVSHQQLHTHEQSPLKLSRQARPASELPGGLSLITRFEQSFALSYLNPALRPIPLEKH